MGVWVAAVVADFVGESIVSDEVLEKFPCSGLVRHGGGKEQEEHCHTVVRQVALPPALAAHSSLRG